MDNEQCDQSGWGDGPGKSPCWYNLPVRRGVCRPIQLIVIVDGNDGELWTVTDVTPPRRVLRSCKGSFPSGLTGSVRAATYDGTQLIIIDTTGDEPVDPRQCDSLRVLRSCKVRCQPRSSRTAGCRV